MERWASFGGVSIVQGEVSLLLSATRRGSRWTGHGRNEEDQDPLILGLYKLQEKLNYTHSLDVMDVSEFIRPFCQIVQSDDTTGPVTGMAIASLEKFLAYNLIDPAHPSAPVAIEALSDAVTHARFVGTNPASDEVVLMKILQILRTLLLSPVGRLLTNESVCDIMQSCFRICFEMRLSELLRCFGENTLIDLVQLLFTRLPTFSEDPQDGDDASSIDQTLMTPHQVTPPPVDFEPSTLTEDSSKSVVLPEDATEAHDSAVEETNKILEEELVSEDKSATLEKEKVLTPYGLPCVRELLRFLVSIITTQDRQANSDSLVAIGLNLVTVVLECGSFHLCTFPALATLVQDHLCKYLFNLLRHDSFVLFSRALRCCCLLFLSCRSHLPFQLEVFINRLLELIAIDGSSKVLYGKRELALEAIVQLCHTPHFPAELYINFDCGLYCTNVFENLTKALSKNAFPTQGAISSTHLLSLEALLAIANNLETDSDNHVSSSTHLDGGHVKNESLNTNTNEYILKPASGYQMGIELSEKVEGEEVTSGDQPKVYSSTKELLRVRQRKKLILAATEQFNKKPKQGISFLQEQGILSSPLDPSDVADFLHKNHWLSKARIGDYIGERKNGDILEAFVSKHSLHDVQMVDALRDFLESFRLPGESPIVERILEVFSQHWLECNSGGTGTLGEVFKSKDSVHVLTYAIMMLNTDLHSSQVKKKMTLDEFIRNQRGVNNKSDFPRPFLKEIYDRIKEEEIIMPDEHSGSVRENYQWKILLRRSSGPEGNFVGVSNGEFDHDLFLLSWGPTIAALSYVYDHADDKNIAQKAIEGFSKCASVAAHFEVKEVFDNLIISLCKFTTLLNLHENSSSLYSLGVNPKIKQSIQTMFSLAHRYGNILREGWKDLLDCILALFKARLLPLQMVEVSDFLHPEGKISLFRDETPVRSDSSILSSIYNYWAFTQESGSSLSASSVSSGAGGLVSGRSLTASEGKARSAAVKCIEDCHPEELFTESKFLRSDALLELIKALIFASRGPDHHESLGTVFDEDAAVFFMKILVTVAIENRDRMSLFWKDVSSHLSRLISSATQHPFLLERGVVSLLHLALRLLGRVDSPVNQVLSSLHSILLSLPPASNQSSQLYRQTAHGLNELIHTHTSTLTTTQHWAIIFNVLEFTGFGMISDLPEDKQTPLFDVMNSFDSLDVDQLPDHEPQAFFKTCESLSFIVRGDHLITSENFSACVKCTRHFTEVASRTSSLEYDRLHTKPHRTQGGRKEKASSPTRREREKVDKGEGKISGKISSLRDTSVTYMSSLLKLLDLIDTLYFKVGKLLDSKTVSRLMGEVDSRSQDDVSEEGSGQDSYCPALDVTDECARTEKCGLVWHMAWCPLLQGMARMCCDGRRSVRQTAITYLQRALLSHDLHDLTGQDWHACFTEVFFPMLTRLLKDVHVGDRAGFEETRVRACNLLCKVFLQHLPSLMTESFFNLWMEILNYMEKFLHLENSDMLHESIPESLKNMLLVMSTQGIFENTTLLTNQSDPSLRMGKDIDPKKLWLVTWNRIDKFLPNFLTELFPQKSPQLLGIASPLGNREAGDGMKDDDSQNESNAESNVTPSPPKGSVVSKPSQPSSVDGDRANSPVTSLYHTPESASPSQNSPVHTSSSPPPDADPSFPIILHPPLPTLTPSPTHYSSPDSSPPQISSIPSHTSINSQGPRPIPVPGSIIGPILGPAAPPYSDSSGSELVSDNTTARLQSVQFSTVSS